jgi:hypothetical protein
MSLALQTNLATIICSEHSLIVDSLPIPFELDLISGHIHHELVSAEDAPTYRNAIDISPFSEPALDLDTGTLHHPMGAGSFYLWHHVAPQGPISVVAMHSFLVPVPAFAENLEEIKGDKVGVTPSYACDWLASRCGGICCGARRGRCGGRGRCGHGPGHGRR